MAGNFAAPWPTDSKFSATKDLNLLKKHTKNQVASSILKVVFAFSKWPHLHRAYLVTVCYRSFIAVCLKGFNFIKKYFEKSSGKCKKSGCSLCKSENPLYKNIPSEKDLLLPTQGS